jgi:hypothetical protein
MIMGYKKRVGRSSVKTVWQTAFSSAVLTIYLKKKPDGHRVPHPAVLAK